MRVFSFAAVLLMVSLVRAAAAPATAPTDVRVYPAPAGVELSDRYTVSVSGQPTPAYVTRIAPADAKQRWQSIGDPVHGDEFFAKAAFTYFDMRATARVTVQTAAAITSVKILPTAFHIQPIIDGNSVSFDLARPCNVTVEINGNWSESLHIFANPFETDAPSPGDPNVIYFGPGVHHITDCIEVGDGKTVYVAGGAVLQASGTGNGKPVIFLHGKHVTLRGRGIIDASACPRHSRNLVLASGQDVTLEGVILNDSSTWTVPIRRCDRVNVDDIKVFGRRGNSDGIDICNSRDVVVDGCFLRTSDDLVVVKSDKGQGPVHHVLVKNCVLWNEVAHALSVGAELRDPIDDVLFTDCDVIHDIGREWTLRIYHCDSAWVKNVRFENIRVEQTQRLISIWIGKAIWSKEADRGHVQDTLFKDITAVAAKPPVRVDLQGFDAQHEIENTTFDDVTINGSPLAASGVKQNQFVTGTVVRP